MFCFGEWLHIIENIITEIDFKTSIKLLLAMTIKQYVPAFRVHLHKASNGIYAIKNTRPGWLMEAKHECMFMPLAYTAVTWFFLHLWMKNVLCCQSRVMFILMQPASHWPSLYVVYSKFPLCKCTQYFDHTDFLTLFYR